MYRPQHRNCQDYLRHLNQNIIKIVMFKMILSIALYAVISIAYRSLVMLIAFC